jgi:cell division septation protein DedD
LEFDLKTRLLGAAVLIALAVLFVPMFFSSNPPPASGDQSVSLDIPPAPDRDLQTQTMSLSPGASVPAPPASGTAPAPAPQPQPAAPQPAPPAGQAAGGDALATVNIASNRPRDVETDPAAKQPRGQTTVTRPGAPAAQPEPSQPLIPAQPHGGAPAARTPEKPAAPAAAPAEQAPATATAAHGHYTINLSAYASAASAQSLAQRVRGLGYPVASRPISQAGRQLTLVTAGPFESRAAAESARLKITQAVPGAPARISASASDQQGDEPAPAPASRSTAAAAPASRAGGWAVQVAAMGSQADANALRDKLRGAGFDGFVDSVNAGGKQLWRVRAGPQTQREDAVRLRDQIKAKLGLAGNVVSAP